ncbi:cell division protein ZipA [Bermanella marisrubri]|uniref:Cell division protein ZipA n=1 Tax=Bermanella marisrubri TaxID=207949 RepID=Q1N5K2_9GAMM|nr:cell division protein ZipA [Bermanella marisrubri]EAT13940.1 cell division protein ZipA [Oceanobacter sp. RED65] [Bermanella marisrubri]QIZ84691.1 cell division protein ZipA [Bermanella marisrubri]
MDISLHSFILVVGLLVIIFIVIDGIKKMRQTKSTPLEEEWLDQDHDLPDDEPLQFDHLEIDDEMLTDHFDLKKTLRTQDQQSKDDLQTAADSSEPETPQFAPQQDDAVQPEMAEPESPEPDFQHAEINESPTEVKPEPAVASEDDVLRAEKQEPAFSVLEEPEDDLDLGLKADSDTITADKVAAEKRTIEKAKKATLNVKAEGSLLTEKAKAAAQSFKQHVQELKHNKKAQEEQLLSAQSQTAKQAAKPKRDLNSDEPVPMLMDPIELGEEVEPDAPQQQELHLPEFVQQTLSDEAVIKQPEEEIRAEKDALLDEYIDDVVSPREEVGERLSERPPAEEIFVIHVLKNSEPWLQGLDLEHIFKACDMRFGEMNIFHRFEEPNAQGKIQFSVVNAVEPGTFDPNNMEAISTPGISLFMSLPGPENPMAAFDAMSEVALVFARNFSAQLQDESHSVLTPQTLEHYRQRIRDYTRRTLKK